MDMKNVIHPYQFNNGWNYTVVQFWLCNPTFPQFHQDINSSGILNEQYQRLNMQRNWQPICFSEQRNCNQKMLSIDMTTLTGNYQKLQVAPNVDSGPISITKYQTCSTTSSFSDNSVVKQFDGSDQLKKSCVCRNLKLPQWFQTASCIVPV